MPLVLASVAAAARDQYVCLVSDGIYDDSLSDVARKLGWSYLGTWTRDRSLAQNLCYRLHPEVETIVKIDSTTLLLPGSIEALIGRARSLKAEGVVDPGAVAPFIPLDGICHRPILQALGLLEEFECRFGRARLSCDGLIEARGDVAAWMWEHVSPLRRTADILAGLPEQLLMAPIRFRSGMVTFDRSFWEAMGRFPVTRRRLMVGINCDDSDGDALGGAALMMSRPIVMTSHVVAGRIAFDRQIDAMSSLLERRPELFVV